MNYLSHIYTTLYAYKKLFSDPIGDVVLDIKYSDEQNENLHKEDVDYLQMSYENIECTKLIIKRQVEKKVSEEKTLEDKMADCCNVAGDIHIEEEITQHETALKLRLKHLTSCERTIAESFHKIDIAYNVDYRSLEVKENFIKYRDILTIRVDVTVKKVVDTGELEDFLAEVNEKILKSEESEKECDRAKESLCYLLKFLQQHHQTYPVL